MKVKADDLFFLFPFISTYKEFLFQQNCIWKTFNFNTIEYYMWYYPNQTVKLYVINEIVRFCTTATDELKFKEKIEKVLT